MSRNFKCTFATRKTGEAKEHQVLLLFVARSALLTTPTKKNNANHLSLMSKIHTQIAKSFASSHIPVRRPRKNGAGMTLPIPRSDDHLFRTPASPTLHPSTHKHFINLWGQEQSFSREMIIALIRSYTAQHERAYHTSFSTSNSPIH